MRKSYFIFCGKFEFGLNLTRIGFWDLLKFSNDAYFLEILVCGALISYESIWTVSPNLSNVPFPRFQLQPTSSCSPWRSLRLTRAFDCGGFSAKTYCDEVFWQDFPLLNFRKGRKGFFRKVIKFKHSLWFCYCSFSEGLIFSSTWWWHSDLALVLTSSSKTVSLPNSFHDVFQNIFEDLKLH